MAKKTDTLDVPCKFGSISIGDEKDGMSITIPNSNLNLTQADFFFTDSQLEIEIAADPNASDDSPGQTKLADDVDVIEATVNVRQFKRDKKNTGIHVSFSKDGIDESVLVSFAKCNGRLKAEKTGQAEKVKRGRKPEATGDDEE